MRKSSVRQILWPSAILANVSRRSCTKKSPAPGGGRASTNRSRNRLLLARIVAPCNVSPQDEDFVSFAAKENILHVDTDVRTCSGHFSFQQDVPVVATRELDVFVARLGNHAVNYYFAATHQALWRILRGVLF